MRRTLKHIRVFLESNPYTAGATERLTLAADGFKAAGLSKQAKEASALLREAKKAVHAGA